MAAARLTAALDRDCKFVLSRKVAGTYMRGCASSAGDILAYVSEVGDWCHGDLWIRTEVVRAAAELGAGVLAEFVDQVVGESFWETQVFRITTRDLITAAICGGGADRSVFANGWEQARSDPASRALLAVAFGDPRVPVEFHYRPDCSAIYEQMWMGIRVRDMGLVDDEQLWRFYERCEERETGGPHASRDAAVRSWLVEMGSRRVTSAVREACVDLAFTARDNEDKMHSDSCQRTSRHT